MLKVKKGFTVIEIAKVVAIVAILAGVWYVSKNKAGADVGLQKIQKFTVLGKVSDVETKRGLSNVKVEGTTSDPYSGMVTTTDSKGFYRMWLSKNSKKPTTTGTIHASALGYRTQSQTITYPSRFSGINFQLERVEVPYGVVTGKVTDQDGKPISMAVVNVYRGECMNTSINYDFTDTNGKYGIALLPGDYCLIISATNYRGTARQGKIKTEESTIFDVTLTHE